MREEELADAKALTARENMVVMKKLVKDWGLGPSKAYDNNIGNNSFWKMLADKWYISLEEARRRSCASCEYGRITPEYLKAMEHVPYNRFDRDGGIRVWCDKFDFICHATRCCSAWEIDKEEG